MVGWGELEAICLLEQYLDPRYQAPSLRLDNQGGPELGRSIARNQSLGRNRVPKVGNCCQLCPYGTEELERQGAPVFGRPVVLFWRLREFACTNRSCPVETFSEALPPLSGA
jgi:hypothetical protein